MIARSIGIAALLLLGIVAPAAAQQQSQSYKFLEAIRGSKSDDVMKALNQPGTTVLNTHDYTTGEGALHIVAKRGDATYLRFLLQRGADPDLRDNKGNTPLLVAVTAGAPDLIQILVDARANVNLANSSGETPLIRAVQRRDLSMVRALLAASADPDQADVIAGMSARDYAHQDTRSPALAKVLDETPKKAKRAAISGPHL